MHIHIANYQHVPRTIGRQNTVIPTGDAAPDLSINNSVQASNATKVSEGPLTNLIIDTLTRDAKRTLYIAFSRVIHRTTYPFSFFDDPFRQKFLSTLCPAWKPPRPEILGGALVYEAYNACMERTIIHIQKDGGGTVVIDGVINVLSKNISNIIEHKPLPFFIENLRSDQNREITRRVVDRLKDVEKDWMRSWHCHALQVLFRTAAMGCAMFAA